MKLLVEVQIFSLKNLESEIDQVVAESENFTQMGIKQGFLLT